MGEISERDVAERAGVELDFVAKLVEVGVLAPDEDGTFTEGDVRRTRLYQGLERTGLPLEAIREALDAGELSFGWLDAPLYDLIAPLSPRSFQDVATETGIPLELLRVLREAIGFALPEPEDRMREDELRIVPLIRKLASKDSPRPSSNGCSASTATPSAGSPRSRRTGGTRTSCSRAWPPA